MAPTYRTAGVWGAGKGSNLTPTEVDENFHELDSRVTDLEENPPVGVGITSISVVDDKIIINLSDGNVQGPFDMPVAAFRWTGEWLPGIEYDPLDVFTVAGVGVFLVLYPYSSPTEFDPDEENTENMPMFQLMFGTTPPEVVLLDTRTADFTLVLDDAGKYLRVVGDSTEAEIVFATIPDDGDVAFPLGTTMSMRQVGTSQIEVAVANTEVVLNTAETYKSRKQGSTLTLVKVGTNEWDLSGDMEISV